MDSNLVQDEFFCLRHGTAPLLDDNERMIGMRWILLDDEVFASVGNHGSSLPTTNLVGDGVQMRVTFGKRCDPLHFKRCYGK